MKKSHFIKSLIASSLLPMMSTSVVAQSLSPSLDVVRMGDTPIIDSASFSALEPVGEAGSLDFDGANINGPSCIRLPEWLDDADKAHPSAKYYLYFGHHAGNYIRMAWAPSIEGPWNIFNVGTNDDPRVLGRGVFDLGPTDEVQIPDGIRLHNHISSPDVEIDHENQQFVLYFHGRTNSTSPSGGPFETSVNQKTVAATSSNGLNFNIPTGNATGGVGGGEVGHGLINAILGDAYFRIFRYGGEMYAFSNVGPIWKSPNPEIPWETSEPLMNSWDEAGQNVNPIFEDMNALYELSRGLPPRYEAGNPDTRVGTPRHFATLLQEDGKTLEVWYTSRGDKPERIFRTTIDLSQGSFEEDTWDSLVSDSKNVHEEMLRPELSWEGADIEQAISVTGTQVNVNQLRDPDLFRDDDGQVYLFYSGAGEEAMGIARVSVKDTDDDGSTDDDEAVFGTDAENPRSMMRQEVRRTSENEFSLNWFSAPGRTYQVEYSNNLTEWQPLDGPITANPPENELTLVLPEGTPEAAFFRIEAEAPVVSISGQASNWKSLDDAPAPILASDTNSPIFGNGTSNSAAPATMTSLFGTASSLESVSLNVGESLTVTATVTLEGGNNIAGEYRFGVYNDGGRFELNEREDWTGGWTHRTNADLFQGRTAGAFVSTRNNAVALNAVATRSGNFDGDATNAPYQISMTITRDSATTVDITSSISGGDNAYSEVLVAEDVQTTLFTYNAFALLTTADTTLDRATLSGVTYTLTPAP